MPRKKPAPLKVEQIAIGKVHAYAKNARLHPDEQVALIASSIAEFGFVNPVLIDAKGVLIAGHGRVLAAKTLGLAEVPAIRLGHLTPAQAKAYRLADNQIPLGSSWDAALLKAELFDLSGAGFDVALTGFDLADFADAPAADPDEVPEPPKNPVTKRGDVWLCGEHRIMCGDSTSAEDVAKLLAGAEPNLMVTDPPYGVEYDPTWRVDTNRFARGKESHGKVANDDRADWREAWALFPGDVAYGWCASMKNDAVIASLEAAKFERRSHIIWVKQHFTFSRGAYHWQHEPCWYAVRTGGTAKWVGGRKQTTVWEIKNPNPMGGSRDDGQTGHGTQKPVECMARPMRNNSKRDEAVYDPFLGSGTSVIAAEMERRVCLGMDMDPTYTDVAVMRWQAFTKKAATLEGDGRTFEEVSAERLKGGRPARRGKS